MYHDTYLSWRGLLHRVEKRARELAAMGIKPGDWVGLLLGNDPELVVLTLALSKLEAVVVPIDPTTGGRDLDMTLEAVPLRAIVTRPNAIDPLAAPAGALRMAGQAPAPRITAESRHRVSGTLLTCSLYPWTRPAVEAGEAPEVVLFTLDAGGDAKAVLRRASHLRAIAATLGTALHLEPTSSILAAAPLYDCQGFDFGLLAALAHGATLYLDDGTAGPRLAKTLVDQNIDLYAATPRDFAALARVTNAKPLADMPSTYSARACPCRDAVARAFRKRFGRARALLLPQLRDRPSGHRSRRDRTGKRGQAPARHRDPHRKRDGRRAWQPAPSAPSGCAAQALPRAFLPALPAARRPGRGGARTARRLAAHGRRRLLRRGGAAAPESPRGRHRQGRPPTGGPG